MSNMFNMRVNLITLDVSGWNINSVTNMSNMFLGCSKLKTIYSNTNWDIGVVTSSSNMFYGCVSLKGAVAYDYGIGNITFANPDTGFFTRKIV